MHIVQVSLKSVLGSPYSQSKKHDAPELEKEGKDAYAARTWASHLHLNEAGNIVLPAMSIKNGLSTTARRLGMKIPGKRNSTFTKHFDGGLMVFGDIDLGIAPADAECEKLFLPSDGVRGSGKRVWKYYPRINAWACTFDIHVLDDTITEKVLIEHLEEFGKYVGVGRFRPQNGGFYGRFEVTKVVWR